MTPGSIRGSATFDPLKLYRYRLTRTWDETRPSLAWIMLNPSTADASVDDPTIRRVIGFSRSWGFGSATVVNLFGLRATHPGDLRRSDSPVGPDNDAVIRVAVSSADGVVAAWGNHGAMKNPDTGMPRHEEVIGLLHRVSARIRCLGTTREGQPRHPLYLPAFARPAPLDGQVPQPPGG